MKLYRRKSPASPPAWALERAPGAIHWLLTDPFAEASSSPTDWPTGEPVPPDAPPLAPVRPSKIVGIGRNYRDHAAELNNPMPKEPVVFLKAPSSLLGDGAAIVLPPESALVQFEGEIALVVGRRLTRASAAEARAAILGIAPACDVTARDIQKGDVTFARGKGFDTFCPLGPSLTLVDGAFDLDSLAVITRLNGEIRQHGHVRDMAWGPVDLLVYVSRFMTLEPGDVLLTGTPAGVGALSPGDRIEVEIPGIATLTNPVVGFKE
jgi:2-keto-4-pentenoate hydratase/2-oxohepta-3-ene-1,7-dioic acid hydratase in catechol pathway